MTTSLGSLVVSLGLDAAQFVDGMNKSEFQARKFMQGVERNLKAAAAAIATTAAGAAAAAVTMTRDVVEQARALERLSSVSGATASQFQYLAAGARAAGVEQDKLADIFKDTQDKVGDFLQNGGGPLKDFFENIAPRAGVTAAQFRELSGPQALGLYVSSLEKANLSQSEMTFYMEGIASDATLLLPMLRNGASGFKQWGDEAQAAGAIMSDQTLRAAKEFDTEVRRLHLHMDGWKNTIAAELLPNLVDLARSTGTVTEEFGKLRVEAFNLTGITVGGFFDEIGLTAANAADFVATVSKEMGGLAKIARGVKELDWSVVKEGFGDALGPALTTTADEFLARQAARIGPPTPEDPRSTGAGGRGRRPGAPGAAGGALRDVEDQAARIRQAVANLISNSDVALAREYVLQVEFLDKLYFDLGLDVEIYDSAMKGLTRSTVTFGEDGRKALEDQASAWLDAIDPMREFNRNLAQLQRMLDAGIITPAQAEALRKSFEDATRQLSEMDQFAIEAARNVQDQLGDTLYDGLQGRFDDIDGAFKRMIDRMVAEAAAAQLARHLMGDFGKTGELGGWLGAGLSALFGGGGIGYGQAGTAAATAMVPNLTGGFVPALAGGGPVEAGGLYRVNERRTELLSVNGKDFLMAGAAGRVRPNPRFASASGERPTVQMTVYATDAESFRRSENQIVAGLGARLGRGSRVR